MTKNTLSTRSFVSASHRSLQSSRWLIGQVVRLGYVAFVVCMGTGTSAYAGPSLETAPANGAQMPAPPSAGSAGSILPPQSFGLQQPGGMNDAKSKPVDVDAELAEIARVKRLMQALVQQQGAPGAGDAKAVAPGASGDKGTAAPGDAARRLGGDLGPGMIGEANTSGTTAPPQLTAGGIAAKASEEPGSATGGVSRQISAGSGGGGGIGMPEARHTQGDVDAFNESLAEFFEQSKTWGLVILVLGVFMYALVRWLMRRGSTKQRHRSSRSNRSATPERSSDRTEHRSRSSRHRRSSRHEDGVAEPTLRRGG